METIIARGLQDFADLYRENNEQLKKNSKNLDLNLRRVIIVHNYMELLKQSNSFEVKNNEGSYIISQKGSAIAFVNENTGETEIIGKNEKVTLSELNKKIMPDILYIQKTLDECLE